MVTGVPPHSISTPNTNPQRKNLQTVQPPQIANVMAEIQHLHSIMTDGLVQATILQTQVPVSRGNFENTTVLTNFTNPGDLNRNAFEHRV